MLVPLYGAALGAGAAELCLWLRGTLPASFLNIAVVLLWALFARLPREAERTAGPRSGTGALAITVAALARWQALNNLVTPRYVAALIACQAVPRAAMIALAWTSRPAGEAGYRFANNINMPGALVAIATGIAAACFCGVRAAIAILGASYLVVRAAQYWCYRRSSGVNANALAVTEQFLEIFVLVLFTCPECRW